MRPLVHFFRPSGKWYAAEEVSWPYHYISLEEYDPYSFAETIELYTRSIGHHRFSGMTAVCTDPNPLGFPQCCAVPE